MGVGEVPASPALAQTTAISRIAFVSERDGNQEIYLMQPNGDNQRNLSNNPADDWQPVWSYDGTRIAFTTVRTGNEEIFIMNADGSNPRNLTNFSGPDNSPSWSPNGEQIVFASERDGWDIYRINSDGSGLQRLTTDRVIKTDPNYSPDGTQIAYWARVDGNNEIFVINADGSNPRRLTNNNVDDGWPRWTSDGLILFDSYRDGNWEIYVMNPDGSNPINLTRHPATDGRPAWSAQDWQIAFSSDREGNAEIYTIYPDGTGLRRLTNNTAPDHSPIWQPPPDFALDIKGVTQYIQFSYTADQLLIENPSADKWMYLVNTAAITSSGQRLPLDNQTLPGTDTPIDRLAPGQCMLFVTPAAATAGPVRLCEVILRAVVPSESVFWTSDFQIDGVSAEPGSCAAAAPAGQLTLCLMPH
jgi:TolB protein